MKNTILSRLLLAIAAVVAAGTASAYSHVVVFGDSLSDSGNNAIVLGTKPGQVITGNSYVPTFPYGSGTYSNGNVWATSFAQALGLSALPSLAGGTDYAYGGAETRGAGYPPNLQKQVGFYLGSSASDAASTLFVIAGGGNNAFSALDKINAGAPARLVDNIAARRFANDVGAMVDSLQVAGAQHIVVWDTPDIGLTPMVLAEGGNASALGTQLASSMNAALATRLAGEPGVVTFDIFGLLKSAVADPAAYGLLNVTDACGALPSCDPQQYLFWDGIHPTSAGHSIIAQGMLDVVGLPVPEPATAWLLVGGGLLLFLRRRLASA